MAYGSPDRYAEVANQVRAKSVVGFLTPIVPSEVLRDKLSIESFQSALLSEYEVGEGFTRFVDSGSKTIPEIAGELYSLVLEAYNEIGSYETSLTDAIEYSTPGTDINANRLASSLISNVADLEISSRIAASIPLAKLDKLPAGTRIDLDDSVSLDTDEKGISFPTGYLTPAQYFEDIAYPGMGSTADDLPASIVQSVREGYSGYATLQPLDDLLRPGFASLLSRADISDVQNVSRAVAGLGTLDTLRDLGGLSSADQALYAVDDLASLIVDMNGYTAVDLAVPVPETSNADPGNGLPASVRPRTTPF